MRFNIAAIVSLSVAVLPVSNAVAQVALVTQPPATGPATALRDGILPGFHRGPYFGDQLREEWIEPGVRVLWNAPPTFDLAKPTRLIVYATPNGNTAEQTLGCALAKGADWHFDIQHIAAQTRRLREVAPDENIVLACVQPDTLSWPIWRQRHADNAAPLRAMVETFHARFTAVSSTSPITVTLAGHSGGGSLIFGFLNGGDTIPDYVDRIATLDANYAYSDAERHGDKLLAWLAGDPKRHLVVIAYDDREITLNGKKVVGPDGGTYRATQRMIARFKKDRPLATSTTGDFHNGTDASGQIVFHVHTNPQNKILHTALVGEMNGFLEAMSIGTPEATSWGTFSNVVPQRAYSARIQPAPGIPARPTDAVGGAAFMAQIAGLTPAAREEAIATEICRGNIPDFLRTFKSIPLTATDATGTAHIATVEAMPDYLTIGSDTDFVRVPMTPMTAQRIADAFGCTLPTRKLSDAIYAHADLKLEPRPLTEAREAVETFTQHNALIEAQRAGKPLGLLIAGIKKDVVVTNRLTEKPYRVAIYGWYKLDGHPIQPLTIVHRDTYVDYSHGIRLLRRTVIIDGKPHDLHVALHDPTLSALFSDEGPISTPSY